MSMQDIFDDHDTPHPIIILNNMNHLHIKSLLEFMYKGEIKVIESELECFLQTAEVLQVKGLCNIRNKEMKRLPTEDAESEPRPKQKKLNEEVKI
jgi:tramtrack